MPQENPEIQKPEKPANPELENVSANRPEGESPSGPPKPPVTPPPTSLKAASGIPVASSAVPTKMKKEPPRKSNTRFLLGCAGGLLLLFVLFVVLMVLVMSRGGGDNAVIAAFGLAPAAIRSFLLTIINVSFGFLALLFFVLMVIGLFRATGAKKTDQETRRRGIKMIIFSLIPFMVLLVVWVFLFNFINRLQITAERVLAEIVVTFPEDLSSLEAPVEVTFSALNVKRALQQSRLAVTSAAWDLDGDGLFETPISPTGEVTRLYERRGLYQVGLNVQVVGEETPRLYTFPLNVQEALFAAEPTAGMLPLTVAFNAGRLMPQGLKVTSLDWDFDGDGRYELSGPKELDPLYTFEKIGLFKVHLRVVDENNTVENYYREIEVKSSDTPLLDPRIEATPSLKGAVPLSIRFDAGKSTSAKGKIIRYEWNFGDGTPPQEGKVVSHLYTQPGTYEAVLAVVDDLNRTAEISAMVEAVKSSSAPVAAILTTPSSSEGKLEGTLPFNVAFDASGSADSDNDIVEYEWDFNGDGLFDQTGKKVTHLFETAGDFSVALTVRDSDGQSSSAALTVRVSEPGLKAVIQANPEEGTAPLTVAFNASASSSFNSRIVSYEWDFGDGSPSTVTGATINHRYDRVGTYAVILKITNSENEIAETTKQIFVREVPLHACFQPSRITGAAPLSVTFDPACATGGITEFHWDFGDTVKSSSRKPAHTFESPGIYTVTLEVLDDKRNVSNYTQEITVLEEE